MVDVNFKYDQAVKYYNDADLIIDNSNDIDSVLKEIKENLKVLWIKKL